MGMNRPVFTNALKMTLCDDVGSELRIFLYVIHELIEGNDHILLFQFVVYLGIIF